MMKAILLSRIITWKSSNKVLCTWNAISFRRERKNLEVIVCTGSQSKDLQTSFFRWSYGAINMWRIIGVIVKYFIPKHLSVSIFRSDWAPFHLYCICSQAKCCYVRWRAAWNWKGREWCDVELLILLENWMWCKMLDSCSRSPCQKSNIGMTKSNLFQKVFGLKCLPRLF